MTLLGEAIGAAIGTIIFWSSFVGLTLIVCAAVDISRRIRHRRRGLELDQHLHTLEQNLHRWDWPPL